MAHLARILATSSAEEVAALVPGRWPAGVAGKAMFE